VNSEEVTIPPSRLRRATSLEVNCPAGAREAGLGHYTREAMGELPSPAGAESRHVTLFFLSPLKVKPSMGAPIGCLAMTEF